MKAQMTEPEYAQEFECSFEAAVTGTYYAGLMSSMEDRFHLKGLYQPEHKVFASADLGYSDSSAWWFWQQRPDGIAVIDYEEANGEALPYYFNMLDSKPYEYERIWLPHDAKAKTLQTGRSTIEQFLPPFNEYPVDLVPRLKVQHGIDATRLILPTCWFDEKCDDGVEGLRAYRRRYNEVTKSFADSPMHNWASHPSDAFRGLALVAKERKVSPHKQQMKKLNTKAEFKLDTLFAENERKGRGGIKSIYG
jgi:phage terminase large subunit